MEKNLTLIRFLRISKGLRLHEMARQTGISITKLSFIERGLIPVKTADIRKISKALGVNLSLVLRGK